MKTLDIQARLEYARAAVAALRALRITDKTMRYGQFATAIGLISDGDRWEPWHRQQITDILNLVAATENQSGTNAGLEPLQYATDRYRSRRAGDRLSQGQQDRDELTATKTLLTRLPIYF